MRKLLRRLRRAVGVSLTWALGWGLIGALLGLVQLPGWVGFGRFGFLDFALVGLLSGGAFSVALDIVGLRRTWDEMSLPLFAGLGALATTLVFTIALRGASFPPVVTMTAIQALPCAGFAAGSLALARMADDRELLEAGAAVADIRLTEEEKRELLAP
jgi:hypothetical protein